MSGRQEHHDQIEQERGRLFEGTGQRELRSAQADQCGSTYERSPQRGGMRRDECGQLSLGIACEPAVSTKLRPRGLK